MQGDHSPQTTLCGGVSRLNSYGPEDRRQKRIIVDRLAQIGDRARGQALGTCLWLIVTGDDHDGQPPTFPDQVPLQIQAVHARHMDIKDEAVRPTRDERIKKFLS